MSLRWFAPRLLGLHALAGLVIAGCIWMGLWQLGVYDAKHEDAAVSARATDPVDILTVWGPDDPFTADLYGRQVWVRGSFVGDEFLVRRSTHRYWVVAPLRVAGTKSLLLVVRGSTAARQTGPPMNDGTVTFRAVLQPGEQGAPDQPRPSDGVYASLSIPQLAGVVRGDLFSGYALTDAAGINRGLQPVEPPDPHVSWTVGLRNLAYALQWWIFGVFAGFMWWRMATDALEVEAAVEEADTLSR